MNKPTENNPRKAGRKRLSRRLRDALKKVGRSQPVISGLSWLGAGFLKLVVSTNRFIVEPEDILETVEPKQPVIVAVWHGQHVLLPAVPIGLHASAMISRSLDGEVTARIVERLGNTTIRASGGRKQRDTLKKGGISGFLDMLNALKSGRNVVQTADIPQGTARRAGLGIVTLAQRSGRPIIPLAIASSRRLVFGGSWDRTTVNLPFGTTAICAGNFVEVPADADDATLGACRDALEAELNRVTDKAYGLTGRPE